MAALTLSCCVAEAALRWFAPVDWRAPQEGVDPTRWSDLIHRRSDVPGLRYELAPKARGARWGVRIRINGHGMRDDEPVPGKPDDLVRIAVLGDSVTFGFGVGVGRTYASVLEKLLNERHGEPGRRFEVLNFGVGGYSSRDEALVLRHKALAFEPDLVLVAYVLNDPENAPNQPLPAYFGETEWWQRSHLLRLVDEVRNERIVGEYGRGSYVRYLHAYEPAWRTVVVALEDMKAAVSEARVPLLIVVVPWLRVETWEPYAYADLHRKVADLAARLGLPTFDLTDAMSRHPVPALRISTEDAHPNRFGHEVMATAIAEHLEREHATELRLRR